MAARKPRLIDKEQLPEASKSVKVLCLGMCRTGTTSLLAALTTLGYTPIHMTLILEDARQKELWTEAIEKTFISGGSEAPYGRAEFDVLLSGYDVALDVPCAIFGEQLINAYPDAKVILTTRPVGSWITSMQSTIWQFMRWPSYRILRYVEPEFMGSFLTLVELIFFVHNKNYGGKKLNRLIFHTISGFESSSLPTGCWSFHHPFIWTDCATSSANQSHPTVTLMPIPPKNILQKYIGEGINR